MTIPAPDALLKHQAFLRALARSLLRDEQAADDVVQETYIKALDGVPRQGNLRGWLATVTRNFALNALRSDRRRARREMAAARSESLPSVEEGVARLEVQRKVVDAVLALDEPYRSVIVHRFFYEFELKEIARRLGLPLETVRTRLRRALARLRESMDKRFQGNRRAWSVVLLPLARPPRASATAATTGGGALLMSVKAKLAIAALLLMVSGVLVIQFAEREPVPEPIRESGAAVAGRATAPATDPEAPGDQTGIVATLDRDLDLHGVVVNAAGGPVAGAQIQSVRYPNVRAHEVGARSHQRVLGPRTTSDVSGRFRLRLARGQTVALRIRADGFATVERRELQAGGRLRIVMQPGLDLPLQVRDTSGRPLTGAVVFLEFAGADFSEASDFYFGIRGVTDAGGRFVAKGLLPSSKRTVIAMHPDFAMHMIIIDSLDASISEDITIDLPTADSVKGIVVDRDTGLPVEGAILSAFPVPYGKTVVTGADGRFEYRGWSHERNMGGALYVLTQSYALARRSVESGREAYIALERGVSLTGRLVDARGAPVAGAYLTAVSDDGLNEEVEIDVREAESGPDGRFELQALRSDLPHTLIVLAEGFGKTLIDLPASDKPRDLEDLQLVGGLRIEGRVLDANNEGLADRHVTLIGANRDRGRLIPAEGRVQMISTLGGIQAGPPPSSFGSTEGRITDDLGRFRFRDLAPGDYELQVYLPEGRALSHRVMLEDADVTDVDFRAPMGRTVTIQVTSEGGDPVQGAWITCSALKIELLTDAEGMARLTLPRDADHLRLKVNAPTETPLLSVEGIHLRPSTEGEMHIVLPSGALVTGTLLGPDGNPVDGGLIQLHAGRKFQTVTKSKVDGSFQGIVPAGATVVVSFDGKTNQGYRPIAADQQTVPAGTRNVVLKARALAIDRTLTVKAIGPDGTPIEGVGIVASPWVECPREPPQTDAEGMVVLEGLPATRVQISIFVKHPHAQARRLAPPQPEWVTPRGQTIELQWKRPAPVSGVVLLPDSRPAKVRIALMANDSGQVVATGVTDAKGQFEVIVPAGEHESLVLVIEPSANRNDPVYADLRPVRRTDIRPGTAGIRVQLEPLE